MRKIFYIFGLVLFIFLSACNGNSNLAALEQATIILGEPLQSLDPFSPIAADHQYLEPIYESLVTFDEELKLEEGLAYSFGKLSETKWQFKIRTSALFHDGTNLSTKTIKDQFDALKSNPPEHLLGILNNISNIEIVDDETVLFELKEADPDFLRRLSQIFIVPTTDFSQLIKSPNGTGSYKLLTTNEDSVTYERFSDYWDELPELKQVTYKSISDPAARASYAVGDMDVIAILPFATLLEDRLDGTDFKLKSQLDLTVSFFIWQPENSIWIDKDKRSQLAEVFPYELIESLTAGQGTPASQFVSTGVLGFNPDLKPNLLDLKKRQSLVDEYDLKGELIRLAVPPELQDFGLALKSEFEQLGLESEAYVVEPDQIFDKDAVEGVHLLFLGWKTRLGTSSNFLTSFFSADSEFNVSGYKNIEAMQLLDELETTYENQDRIPLMQEIMRLISKEDPFGLPLFYGRLPYALKKGVSLPIRPDGIILLKLAR